MEISLEDAYGCWIVIGLIVLFLFAISKSTIRNGFYYHGGDEENEEEESQ